MQNKEDLRIWAKTERKKLDIDKISKKLAEKLQKSPEYKNAKNILIYYPKKDEVNLLYLLDDKDKNFYLPKIDGENLLCCQYKQGDETCLSSFKTCEPITEACDKRIVDLIIVPALAVDKNNNRLGYGGGYYDRFLLNCSAKKVVCIPKELVTETVFPQEHDIQMDLIITE